LIFASLAEDQADIIADSGISAKVTSDAWAGAIAALVTGIKAGRLGDSFVAAIELCGTELARNVPPGETQVQ
jgi:putative membrane protein